MMPINMAWYLHICGDMQEYGWVYIGTHGRGIVTGVPSSD